LIWGGLEVYDEKEKGGIEYVVCLKEWKQVKV
jgi:hypothetical protein